MRFRGTIIFLLFSIVASAAPCEENLLRVPHIDDLKRMAIAQTVTINPWAVGKLYGATRIRQDARNTIENWLGQFFETADAQLITHLLGHTESLQASVRYRSESGFSIEDLWINGHTLEELEQKLRPLSEQYRWSAAFDVLDGAIQDHTLRPPLVAVGRAPPKPKVREPSPLEMFLYDAVARQSTINIFGSPIPSHHILAAQARVKIRSELARFLDFRTAIRVQNEWAERKIILVRLETGPLGRPIVAEVFIEDVLHRHIPLAEAISDMSAHYKRERQKAAHLDLSTSSERTARGLVSRIYDMGRR